MWKFIFGSVPGTSHMRSGLPCQDYSAAIVSGTTLIASCADGAGSAEFSQIGSEAAVTRFISEVSDQYVSEDGAPTIQQMQEWVEAARVELLEQATKFEAAPRQLACTFLAALVGDTWAAFIQIGDGAIVFDGPDHYEFAFWPENGEYANTTYFLSDENFREHLRIKVIDRPISELAVMTDGLQMLSLDVAAIRVYDPFFSPLFNTLRGEHESARLQTALIDFMSSQRVNDRTDDDKTLILATRLTSNVSQDLPDTAA